MFVLSWFHAPPIYHYLTLSLGCVSSGMAAIVAPSLESSANLIVFSGGGPENLTNNDGLFDSLGVPTTVNNGATLSEALSVRHVFDGGFQESYVTTNPNGGSGDFFANGTAAPEFVWDVGLDVNGSVQSIQNIVLWNYQNTGGGGPTSNNDGNATRTIELTFSNDSNFASTLGTQTITLLRAADPALSQVNGAQVFDTGNVQARYVRMRLLDNYFGQPGLNGGGDRIGLGEIRFDAVPVPEPTTGLLLPLAVLALMRRRR